MIKYFIFILFLFPTYLLSQTTSLKVINCTIIVNDSSYVALDSNLLIRPMYQQTFSIPSVSMIINCADIYKRKCQLYIIGLGKSSIPNEKMAFKSLELAIDNFLGNKRIDYYIVVDYGIDTKYFPFPISKN